MNDHCDILIVGGSFGGIAAALACARLGVRCRVMEETRWIGGQATGQGVPLDEHPWIEQYGRTRSYATFRQGVRDYYRRNYPLTTAAASDPYLNPGAAWVTGLSYEPRVGLAVLRAMLAPYESAGLVLVQTGWKPVAAQVEGDKVQAVTFEGWGKQVTLEAYYVLDATEMGDLLPLTGTEYRVGAEAMAQTGEPLALDGPADPWRQQPFTHLISVDYLPGENHVIDKPLAYERLAPSFRNLRGHLDEAILTSNPSAGFYSLFARPNMKGYIPTIWNFRRSLCAANFVGFNSDITMLMNGNEYHGGVLLDTPDDEKKGHLEAARQLSRCLLYYLQTEVEDGYEGKPGFPGLRPRPDVFETADGLAQYPYIRESRRLEAEFTVLEQHFRMDIHPEAPMSYPDTVGLGGYRIDIHEKAKNTNKSITTTAHGKHWTQQIPLGAMIPVRMENLLPACKNLGVTHVTNGAFRLHPVEWNVGEAAGALAAFCVRKGLSPRAVRNTPVLLADFQQILIREGVELHWPHYRHGRSYFSHYAGQRDFYFGEAFRNQNGFD